MEITIKDQLGRLIRLPKNPTRIISLVPSQTELLIDLGLEDKIVGITKFCVHPKHLRKTKKIVGGTKKVSFEKIEALEPDIILCNKEENTKELVEKLAKKYAVHVSDIATISDTLNMIQQYGHIFQCENISLKICTSIQEKVSNFKTFIKNKPQKEVLYFIWKKPWMSVGNDTFIHHLLDINGFSNSLKSKQRYPEILETDFALLQPDFVFLSSEPFPFKEEHAQELKNKFPEAKIVFVDGEYFSWYGSRLLYAFDYFKALRNTL